MKIKFTLMAMLLPFFCLAQTEKSSQQSGKLFEDSIPQTAIYLKDRSIIYQKVFTSKLKKEELANRLNVMLNMIKSFRLNPNAYTNENEFFGRLYGYKFDVSKEDINMLNNSGLLTYPLHAIVAIQAKDNKYRVTVSKMEFKQNPLENNDSFTLDYFLKEKKGSALKKNRGNLALARALDRDFNILFDVDRSVVNGDF